MKKTIMVALVAVAATLSVTGCVVGEPLEAEVVIPDGQAISLNTQEGVEVLFSPPGISTEKTVTYILTYPTHGTLREEEGKVYYMPNPGYNGVDQFSIEVRTIPLATAETNTSSTSVAVPTPPPVKYVVTVTVSDVDVAPKIVGIPAPDARIGVLWSFTPVVVDNTPLESLIISAQGTPSWMSFDRATVTFSGTPASTDSGTTSNFGLVVSDGEFTTASDIWAVAVSSSLGNTPPAIGGAMSSFIKVGDAYLFVPTASDDEGDALTFSVTNKPRWATFDTQSGVLSGTPTDTDAGTYPDVSISVSDGRLVASLDPVTITVASNVSGNTIPLISGVPSTTVTAGQRYSFTPLATDEDGDPLAFMIANKPDWATFDTASGTLSGTPSLSGEFPDIVISVTDGKDMDSLDPFTITVASSGTPTPAGNTAPVIEGIMSSLVKVGASYSFIPTASDVDGDPLTFIIAGKPAWATFNTATGELSGNPMTEDIGDYPDVTISVYDGKAQTSLSPVTIMVVANAPGNTAPVISGVPSTRVTAGQMYSFTPLATDDDNDDLAFVIANKPDWATFDVTTGELSGVPLVATPADDEGYIDIVISVTDHKDIASLDPFTIIVK